MVSQSRTSLTRKRTEMAKDAQLSSNNAEASITSHQLVEVVSTAAKAKPPQRRRVVLPLCLSLLLLGPHLTLKRPLSLTGCMISRLVWTTPRGGSTGSSSNVKVVDTHILEANAVC